MFFWMKRENTAWMGRVVKASGGGVGGSSCTRLMRLLVRHRKSVARSDEFG